jgi:hypothetical protein
MGVDRASCDALELSVGIGDAHRSHLTVRDAVERRGLLDHDIRRQQSDRLQW